MTREADARGRQGLEAVVPFTFSCHRSGRCCTAGEGHVYVQEREVAGLAEARGMSAEAFAQRFLRQVQNPRTGERALALREEPAGSGRCALLEGTNECTVYEARPEHCASFPFWPGITEDAAGFERARAICPGIQVVVGEEVKRAAFAELEALYAEVDAFVERSRSVCIRRGVCCRFEEAGHEVFATGLEADFAADRHPHANEPEAEGRCPYHVQGRCEAREGRPLACRTYFCDTRTQSVLSEAHEHFLERLREIAARLGYPRVYARFPELLRGRGVGTP